MKTRAERRVAVRYHWDRLKVSFWFAPTIMALGAVLLAWGMYWSIIASPMKPYRVAVSSWLERSVNCGVPC